VRQIIAHDGNRGHTQGKRNENGHAAQARQRNGVQVPLVRRDGYPSATGCKIPHIASENEREQQREEKNRKKNYGQLPPSPSDHERRRPILNPTVKVLQQRGAAGSELTGPVCVGPCLRVVRNLSALEASLQLPRGEKPVENEGGGEHCTEQCANNAMGSARALC